jgi:ribosome-binding protein aMBF1 (putative translation factor)
MFCIFGPKTLVSPALSGQSRPMKTLQADSSSERAGDLAHHLVAARSALKLSVEQVAARADIQPNYLRYLESSTSLASETCLRRLAAALETSEEVLLGAAHRYR